MRIKKSSEEKLYDFIEKSTKIHNNKYNYSKTIYENCDKKIIIICPIHGEFLQTPYCHHNGQGCNKCKSIKIGSLKRKDLILFLNEAKSMHEDKYDYSSVIYKNNRTKIDIICKKHGLFKQVPYSHLQGFGCPSCSGLKKLTTEEFIKKANIIHNNKYDYLNTKYKNTRSIVEITCPIKDHGIFQQKAGLHLRGNGCPKCLFKGQVETYIALSKILNVKIIQQKHIFCFGKRFIIDFSFILNDKMYFVEYNGSQHYMPIKFNGISFEKAEIMFDKQIKRDIILEKFCYLNNIELIKIDSRKIYINKIEQYLRSLLPIENDNNDIDKKNNFEISYGFEDIAICQQKNICESRLDTNIKSEIIKDIFIDIPLIASNMSTVINAEFYIKLQKMGAFGFLHRAKDKKQILDDIKNVAKECQYVAASIGTEYDQFDFSKEMILSGCNIIVIDVAHGYSDSVINLGRKIKIFNPNTKIIIGNTTNINIIYECLDFTDALKVGIAQGFACETKNTAGCTEKQFSAVFKFKELSKKYGIPVISDGAIREPSDFTKAIAAGANSVMAGKIFAACPESAAEIEYINDVPKKVYAGMASRYVQEQWKGKLKKGTCPEGGIRYLDIGESLEKLLERYSGALRSGITYSGAKDIKTLQENVKFVILKS